LATKRPLRVVRQMAARSLRKPSARCAVALPPRRLLRSTELRPQKALHPTSRLWRRWPWTQVAVQMGRASGVAVGRGDRSVCQTRVDSTTNEAESSPGTAGNAGARWTGVTADTMFYQLCAGTSPTRWSLPRGREGQPTRDSSQDRAVEFRAAFSPGDCTSNIRLPSLHVGPTRLTGHLDWPDVAQVCRRSLRQRQGGPCA
jgi:hypothetical protein